MRLSRRETYFAVGAVAAVALLALDRYLIMLAEHSLNASTFAVRVSASTLCSPRRSMMA